MYTFSIQIMMGKCLCFMSFIECIQSTKNCIYWQFIVAVKAGQTLRCRLLFIKMKDYSKINTQNLRFFILPPIIKHIWFLCCGLCLDLWRESQIMRTKVGEILKLETFFVCYYFRISEQSCKWIVFFFLHRLSKKCKLFCWIRLKHTRLNVTVCSFAVFVIYSGPQKCSHQSNMLCRKWKKKKKNHAKSDLCVWTSIAFLMGGGSWGGRNRAFFMTTSCL